MSLYRTYRPTSFADVSGQEHVISTLEKAVKHGKLAHAYLFAGSRGTGKTSVARILAKAIMTTGVTDDVLRKHIETGVDDGSIVDLLEFDAASNTSVDDIRDIIEKIQFSPVAAAAKVYIIDEVHMLSKGAFNALLKTLEEPPSYAYFILATTELNKIPPTIQSRCQCYAFRHIRDEDIIRRLQFIADSEKISIDRDALRAIATHVEGGMRDAISLLDQLQSLDHIALTDVQQRIGSAGHEYVDQILHAMSDNDAKALITAVRSMEIAGIPLDIFLRQLLGAVRRQLHAAIEAKEPTDGLFQTFNSLLAALRDVRIAPVPGLALEAALLSLCNTSSGVTQPKNTSKAPVKTVAPAVEPVVVPIEQPHVVLKPETPTPIGAVEAIPLTLEGLRAAWAGIVSQVTPSSVRMSLKDCRVQKVEGATITLTFGSDFHRSKVSATAASRGLEELIEATFKRPVKILCMLETADTAVPQSDNTVNLAEAAAEIF